MNVGVGSNITFLSNPTTAGDYRLFQYGSVNPAGLNNFTLPTVIGETYTLSTTVDSGYVDLVAGGSLMPSGGTWNSNQSGSWGLSGNWSPVTVPSSGTVTFPSVAGTSASDHGRAGRQSHGGGPGVQCFQR